VANSSFGISVTKWPNAEVRIVFEQPKYKFWSRIICEKRKGKYEVGTAKIDKLSGEHV